MCSCQYATRSCSEVGATGKSQSPAGRNQLGSHLDRSSFSQVRVRDRTACLHTAVRFRLHSLKPHAAQPCNSAHQPRADLDGGQRILEQAALGHHFGPQRVAQPQARLITARMKA